MFCAMGAPCNSVEGACQSWASLAFWAQIRWHSCEAKYAAADAET